MTPSFLQRSPATPKLLGLNFSTTFSLRTNPTENMKKNRTNHLLTLLIAGFATSQLLAASYTWNGSTTGGATGTSNDWDTTTANWTGTATTWPSTSTGNDDAVFNGTPGTVTSSSAVTANDITFSQTSSASYTIGADNSTGVITLDGTTPTINSAGNASSNTIGAIITGTSGLTKTGTRTLQLRGANTYTGDTRVQNGNLLIGLTNNRLPIGTTLILGNSTASGQFQMNSRSQQVAGLTTSGTGTGNRVVNSSVTISTFTVNNSADFTFSGILGGTGTNDNNYNFTKSASGKLTLTAVNTFTGTTTISGGTLTLGHATNTLADTIPVNVNGGTLDIGANTDTVGAVTLTSGTIDGTTGTLTGSSYAVKAGTINAKLAGAVAMTKDTSGTVTINSANTFTGAVTITAGRLTLANSAALGSGTKNVLMQGTSRSLWLKGNITVPASVTLIASSNSGDGGGINNESGNNVIASSINISTGNPSLNISSADGSLVITGNITQSIDTRPLLLGGASTNANTISGTISDGAANAALPVIKQGTGLWILSGANTYRGSTTINGGTLEIAATGSLKVIPKADGTSNKITGTGTLNYKGALNIDLTQVGAAANLTTWSLIDVDTLAETFDSTFAVTGFTEKSPGVWKKTEGDNTFTFSEATGQLTLSIGSPASPFETWMSSNFPSLTSNNGATDDADGDGLNNLVEFALSGDPTSGSNQGLQRHSVETISNTPYLTYTFACRDGAVFSGSGPTTAAVNGVTYSLRATDDLSAFTLGLTEVTPAITTGLGAAPSGYSYRTFRLTDALSAHAKAFIQLNVTATAP